jgi:hypothetical protein
LFRAENSSVCPGKQTLCWKSIAFAYFGPVDYVNHQGSEPMSVTFTLENKI